jgi:hypothetical protein
VSTVRSLYHYLSQLVRRAVSCQMLCSAVVKRITQLRLQLWALTRLGSPAVPCDLAETKAMVHCCVTDEVLLILNQISLPPLSYKTLDNPKILKSIERRILPPNVR